MTRRTSWSRPMTGSSLPRSAASVRSRPNLRAPRRCPRRRARSRAARRAPRRPPSGSRPGRGSAPAASASSRCSTATYSSFSASASVNGLLERLAGRAARRRLHVARPPCAAATASRASTAARIAAGMRARPSRGCAAATLASCVEQREQQVVGGELGVAAGDGVALGGCEGLLGLYGEFREVHIAGGSGVGSERARGGSCGARGPPPPACAAAAAASCLCSSATWGSSRATVSSSSSTRVAAGQVHAELAGERR